jgi:hypothetical protein
METEMQNGYENKPSTKCSISDSSVSIMTRLRSRRSGFNSRQGQWWNFASSTPRPVLFWGPPSLLTSGNRSLLPRKYIGGSMKLTIYIHPVPRLRMRGAIHSLPQYVFMEWCLVKHRHNYSISISSTSR